MLMSLPPYPAVPSIPCQLSSSSPAASSFSSVTFCNRCVAVQQLSASRCGPAEPQQKHICCFQQTGLIYSEMLLIRSCKCQRGNMKAFVPKCQIIRLINDARVYLAVCHECQPASDSHIKATTFYFIFFLNKTFQRRC